MPRSLHPFWVTFALALSAPELSAQPLLVRSDTASAAPSVRTPQGESTARLLRVEPSANLVVAIAASTLSAEDADAIRKALPSLYKAAPEALRIAVLSGKGVQLAGPFRVRRGFQDALKGIEPDTDLPAPPSASAFYSALPGMLSQFGSDWPSILLIARFPALDPELHNFASTFLAAKLLTQQTRFSYWNLAAEPLPFFDAAVLSTGGMTVAADLAGFADFMNRDAQTYAELAWEEKLPPRGFDLHQDEVALPDGPLHFPHIALAPGVEMPDLDRYALYREQL